MSGARPRRYGLAPDELAEPDGYPDWTAAQKQAWLWKTLIGGTAHEPTSLPPLRLPFQSRPLRELGVVLRPTELDKALTRVSDLMEPGRPKVIHARGSVALVDLETDPASPFTGLLGPPGRGGATGLIRMSLVAKVDRNKAYTPALALKLLIDGHPSADVLAMNHTVGQGRDFNLFSNSMTNDLTDEHDELRPPQKVMARLFKRISDQPRRMMSDHLVQQHRDGSTVGEPIAPRRLVFRPTSAARATFERRAGVDFRLVLAEIEPGTVLYEVIGLADGEHPVGAIRTTTRFVSSDGGDRLYIQHVHDPADHKPPLRS